MSAAEFPAESLPVIEFHGIKYLSQKGRRRGRTGGNHDELAADAKVHDGLDRGKYLLDAQY